MGEIQLTTNQLKLHKRAEQRNAARQAEAVRLQQAAREAIVEARANMHTGMNRARRRSVARQHGIFRFKGVWAGLLDREVLDKKIVQVRDRAAAA